MEPSTLLLLVAVLACPIGMGLMMWMTAKRRNMGGQQGQSMSGHNMPQADRLKTLREQRRQLEQEIAEAEKIAALEEKKKALTQSTASESRPVENIRQ